MKISPELDKLAPREMVGITGGWKDVGRKDGSNAEGEVYVMPTTGVAKHLKLKHQLVKPFKGTLRGPLTKRS